MTDDPSPAEGPRPDAAMLERLDRLRAARRKRELVERIAQARKAIDDAKARPASRVQRRKRKHPA